MASQSHVEVVDPDWGSLMERNRENQVTLKYHSEKGETANR
jgi:hypothetical protein